MIASTSNEIVSAELKQMYAYIDQYKDTPDEFKFDLDDIWRHLGYKRKEYAAKQTEKLTENTHFVRFGPTRSGGRGGQNRKVYMLSSIGLEKLATACGTAVGAKIRDYLISLRHAVRDGDLGVAGQALRNFNTINNTDAVIGNMAGDEKVHVAVRPSINYVTKKRGFNEEADLLQRAAKVAKLKNDLKIINQESAVQEMNFVNLMLKETNNIRVQTHLNSVKMNALISYNSDPLLMIESKEHSNERWHTIVTLASILNIRLKPGESQTIGLRVARTVREQFPNVMQQADVMQRFEDGISFSDAGKAVMCWHYRGEGANIAKRIITEMTTTNEITYNERLVRRIDSFFKPINH